MVKKLYNGCRVNLAAVGLLLFSALLAACDTGTATSGPTAAPQTSAPTSVITSTAQTTTASSATTTARQAATSTAQSTTPNPATTASATTGTTTTSASGQSAPTFNTGEVDSYINQMMSLYNVPGVAVAFIQNGKVVYQKGYGVRSTRTNAPVTENTLFGLGSVTKSFTALDIAQLVSEGKVDLDAPVVKYLPDFKLSEPDATQKLTVRQLISHTSGLPRTDDWLTNTTRSRQQLIADMAKIPLTAEPGKYWQYCNQNFVVAGAIVEKVSGQTWEDYTQQHIFTPLGMTMADFDTNIMQQAPDFALPHALNVLTGEQPVNFFSVNSTKSIGPAGEINANIADMAKYALFQLGDGTAGGQPLVPQNLLAEMHTQQIALPKSAETNVDTGAPVTTNPGYGFGWFTEDYQGLKVVQHSGTVTGFTANVTLVPSARSGVVILTNGNGADLFVNVVSLRSVEFLFGLPSQQDLSEVMGKNLGIDPAQHKANLEAAKTFKTDPTTLQQWVGSYDGIVGQFSIAAQGGSLYFSQKGQQLVSLLPYKDGGFVANTYQLGGAEFTFAPGPNGQVTVSENGKVIGARLDDADRAKIYHDPKSRFDVTIPDGLTAQPQGDLLKLQAGNPAAVLVVTTADATSDDMQSSARAFIKIAFDPAFNLDPSEIHPVVTGSGKVWAQYLYNLPDGQVLAVIATRQGGSYYYMAVQAKTADVTALTPTLNSLLLRFEITQ